MTGIPTRWIGGYTMGVSARALDGVHGLSAVGVPARLDRLDDAGWEPVALAQTDVAGEITEWVDKPFARGHHRIVFDSDSYFAGLGLTAAYPEIAVSLWIMDESGSCQVQLVLAPSSYSLHFETRGSPPISATATRWHK